MGRETATELRSRPPARCRCGGSHPVDFEELFHHLDRSPFEFLLLYSGLGFDSAYPELELHRYLKTGGRLLTAVLRRPHIVAAIAVGLLAPKNHRRYVTGDPLQRPAWIARMRDNNLGFLAPVCPRFYPRHTNVELLAFLSLVAKAHPRVRLCVDATTTPLINTRPYAPGWTKTPESHCISRRQAAHG